MNINNKMKIWTFVARRAQEPQDPMDQAWSNANRQLVIQSAVWLYQRLVPEGLLDTREILRNVATWSFQRPLWMSERVEEVSELSTIEDGKSPSVLEIEKRMME